MLQKRSRSTLFLMEQLIVILIFSVCAAACVKTFVGAYLMTVGSKDKNGAVLLAESSAECFKATSGDLTAAASILGGGVSDEMDLMTAYYDNKWRTCAEEEAEYILTIDANVSSDDMIALGEITVTKHGGKLISLTAAARRKAL